MIVRHRKAHTITIDAAAKVNLFLHVLSKRPDGYHNIRSLFQAVSLFDRIQFHRRGQVGVSIRLADSVAGELPLDESNLIAQTYRLMQERYELSGGLEIRLQKRIPIAAGLGGGSADAAATIVACNSLFELSLSRSEMASLGLEIGSDLPFFFSSGQALVTGRGENIQPVQLPTDYAIVLVTPQLSFATGQAYAELKLDLTNPKNPFNLASCRKGEDLVHALAAVGNDFEVGHRKRYPELEDIAAELEDWGASLVRMSGSGPTMFGIFSTDLPPDGAGMRQKGNWQIHRVSPMTF